MVHDPKIKGSVQWHQHCHCLQMIHFPSWVGQATLIFDSRQKRQLGYSQLTFLALNDSQHQSKDKPKFHDGYLLLLGKNYVKSTEKSGKRRLMLSIYMVSQPVYIYVLLWSESLKWIFVNLSLHNSSIFYFFTTSIHKCVCVCVCVLCMHVDVYILKWNLTCLVSNTYLGARHFHHCYLYGLFKSLHTLRTLLLPAI